MDVDVTQLRSGGYANPNDSHRAAAAVLESVEHVATQFVDHVRHEIGCVLQDVAHEREALQREITRYRELCAQAEMMLQRATSARQSHRDSVAFSVRDQLFRVPMAHIESVEHDHMLKLLVHEELLQLDGGDETILLDRSPDTFAHIVDYLRIHHHEQRDGAALGARRAKIREQQKLELRWRCLTLVELSLLTDEAIFFGLEDLRSLVIDFHTRRWFLQFPFHENVTRAANLAATTTTLDGGKVVSLAVCPIGNGLSYTEANDFLVACGFENGALVIAEVPSFRIRQIVVVHMEPVWSLLWVVLGAATATPSRPSESIPVDYLLVSASKDGKLAAHRVDVEHGIVDWCLCDYECDASFGAVTCSVAVCPPPPLPAHTSTTSSHSASTRRAESAASSGSFFAGHASGSLTLWTLQRTSNRVTGSPIATAGRETFRLSMDRVVVTLAGAVRSAVFLSSETDEILVAANGTCMDRLNVRRGTLLGPPLEVHEQKVRCVVAMGSFLASGCLGGDVLLWSVRDLIQQQRPAPIRKLFSGPAWIADLQWMPAVDWMYVACDRWVVVVEISSGAVLREIDFGHRETVRCVRFLGPARAITTSYDGTARYWDGDHLSNCAACGRGIVDNVAD